MKKKKTSTQTKIGIVLACAVIICSWVFLLQKGMFTDKTDEVVLTDGSKIVFTKAKEARVEKSLDMDVTVKNLTDEEIKAIFGNMSVTADAIYKTGGTGEPIGFEGKCGKVKINISTTGQLLTDTVIEGASTSIEGTDLNAGFFVSDKNSKGQQTAIYFATFKIGESTVYVENADTLKNKQKTKKQLVECIQELIESVRIQ